MAKKRRPSCLEEGIKSMPKTSKNINNYKIYKQLIYIGFCNLQLAAQGRALQRFEAWCFRSCGGLADGLWWLGGTNIQHPGLELGDKVAFQKKRNLRLVSQKWFELVEQVEQVQTLDHFVMSSWVLLWDVELFHILCCLTVSDSLINLIDSMHLRSLRMPSTFKWFAKADSGLLSDLHLELGHFEAFEPDHRRQYTEWSSVCIDVHCESIQFSKSNLLWSFANKIGDAHTHRCIHVHTILYDIHNTFLDMFDYVLVEIMLPPWDGLVEPAETQTVGIFDWCRCWRCWLTKVSHAEFVSSCQGWAATWLTLVIKPWIDYLM